MNCKVKLLKAVSTCLAGEEKLKTSSWLKSSKSWNLSRLQITLSIREKAITSLCLELVIAKKHIHNEFLKITRSDHYALEHVPPKMSIPR